MSQLLPVEYRGLGCTEQTESLLERWRILDEEEAALERQTGASFSPEERQFTIQREKKLLEEQIEPRRGSLR